ncbi:L,D-transpeptidase [Aestuariivirga sp.]|uniref:L,D-transpeptidase n=1 Tax=Aestuariivirga sp. TaxID=2650926 RepID=UPI0039E67FDF
MLLSRRSLLAAAAGLALPRAARADEPYPVNMDEWKKLPYKFQRQQMAFETTEPPGTVVVDPRKCFLYLVQDGGQALRYGVAVGKSAHAWEGEVIIHDMKEWPTWTPAPYHIKTKPDLAKWLPGGMPGGPDNPLGARAMYLFKGEVDTINRIHGAAHLGDIGKKATAGCIGMLNGDVIDLYTRVQVGTRVVMLKKSGFFG